MKPCPYPPEELLPHAPPMVLLDAVVGWEDDAVSARLTIRPDTLFYEPSLGVPVHVGIEWMAQTCGIFAGLEAKTAQQPVRLGFLLGTRQFKASRRYFVEGERLEVGATLVFREEGMAVFDCRIRTPGGEQLAFARLTLYQPEDASDVLANQSMG